MPATRSQKAGAGATKDRQSSGARSWQKKRNEPTPVWNNPQVTRLIRNRRVPWLARKGASPKGSGCSQARVWRASPLCEQLHEQIVWEHLSTFLKQNKKHKFVPHWGIRSFAVHNTVKPRFWVFYASHDKQISVLKRHFIVSRILECLGMASLHIWANSVPPNISSCSSTAKMCWPQHGQPTLRWIGTCWAKPFLRYNISDL